jgi:hypothetical protein
VNWDARAAWIYEDTGFSDVAPKLTEHQIGAVYVDPRSANIEALIADIRSHGLVPGIYTDPSWMPQMNGVGFAQWTSYMLNKYLPRTSGEAPPYMADLEQMSLPWQRTFLAAYRLRQPRRPSSVTVAAFQGPVLALTTMRLLGFHLYPQLYYGDMSSADAAAVVLELVRLGFPADRVHPFYDGVRLPSDARDGCVFTLERIP